MPADSYSELFFILIRSDSVVKIPNQVFIFSNCYYVVSRGGVDMKLPKRMAKRRVLRLLRHGDGGEVRQVLFDMDELVEVDELTPEEAEFMEGYERV